MKYVRYFFLLTALLLPQFAHAQWPPKDQYVGTMINAYTCISRFTNQVGYDWETESVTLIYRGGPPEEYPNQGNGSLVLNTSTDGGFNWSGHSPVLNEDLPSDVPGNELYARHPNISLYTKDGATGFASLWGTGMVSPLNQGGILGNATYKAGPLEGPYIGGMLDEDKTRFHFPSRIVRDQYGNLFALVQLRDPVNDSLTGNFALMTSVDGGESWDVNIEHPALRQSDLPPGVSGPGSPFQLSEDAISMDVSPDGSTLYIGFVAIVPTAEATLWYVDYSETLFGYVRSTDAGQTWSAPAFHTIDSWAYQHLPTAGLNTLDGSVLPAIATVVDGLNEPHFLVSVDGGDRSLPLDSTLLGELTIDAENATVPPTFFSVRQLNRRVVHRFFNPGAQTAGPQPRKSIFQEPEWSKTPDGMILIAKWIDTDSLFKTAPDSYPYPVARDSAHDVYLAMKFASHQHDGYNGWGRDTPSNQLIVLNASRTPRFDEKFTKMNYYSHPALQWSLIIYTMMGGVHWGGMIVNDVDDISPAELYLIPFEWPIIDIWPDAVDAAVHAASCTLAQNYPNPVRASTSIRFALEHAMNVRITVSDLLGRDVATLTEGFREAGSHSVQFTASGLPAGEYIYRMEAGGQTVTRMMSVVR